MFHATWKLAKESRRFQRPPGVSAIGKELKPDLSTDLQFSRGFPASQFSQAH